MREASHVPTRPGKRVNEAERHRVTADAHKNDRNGRGYPHGGAGSRRRRDHNHRRVESHKFLHESGEPLALSLPKSRLNANALSRPIPNIAQRCLNEPVANLSRRRKDHPDYRNLALLLCKCSEWICERTRAKRNNQFAAIVHSPSQSPRAHYAKVINGLQNRRLRTHDRCRRQEIAGDRTLYLSARQATDAIPFSHRCLLCPSSPARPDRCKPDRA